MHAPSTAKRFVEQGIRLDPTLCSAPGVAMPSLCFGRKGSRRIGGDWEEQEWEEEKEEKRRRDEQRGKEMG